MKPKLSISFLTRKCLRKKQAHNVNGDAFAEMKTRKQAKVINLYQKIDSNVNQAKVISLFR